MCYIWKPFDDFFGPLIQLEYIDFLLEQLSRESREQIQI